MHEGGVQCKKSDQGGCVIERVKNFGPRSALGFKKGSEAKRLPEKRVSFCGGRGSGRTGKRIPPLREGCGTFGGRNEYWRVFAGCKKETLFRGGEDRGKTIVKEIKILAGSGAITWRRIRKTENEGTVCRRNAGWVSPQRFENVLTSARQRGGHLRWRGGEKILKSETLR